MWGFHDEVMRVLLCESRSGPIVEYALQNLIQPIGVSTYRVTASTQSRCKLKCFLLKICKRSSKSCARSSPMFAKCLASSYCSGQRQPKLPISFGLLLLLSVPLILVGADRVPKGGRGQEDERVDLRNARQTLANPNATDKIKAEAEKIIAFYSQPQTESVNPSPAMQEATL